MLIPEARLILTGVTLSYMPLKSILIAPSASFWRSAARALLIACREPSGRASQRDFADWRVVLPTFAHAQQLKVALSVELGGTFVLPQFCTLSGWLMTLPPLSNVVPSSERLMRLYAELRQHGWLKKLFTARRNTDLLPLVQTLLALSDELTQALLPALHAAYGAAADLEQRWQHALEQLSPDARNILSDETQLVWSIWKSQLDADDAIAARFSQTLQLAAQANQPLAWISSVAPEPLEQAFLDAYAARQPVLTITLDWRAPALSPTYSIAWPEMVEAATDGSGYPDEASHSEIGQIADPALSTELALCAAQSVEDEAVQGAQMVIDWLQGGKTNLAIVAQDRVVARRIRALLERAQIHVVDETGWKLSTTRAASAISAWFDVVTTRAETRALLDLLKSPFVLNQASSDLLHDAQDSVANKSALVMKIELLLRRANVLGEWRSMH